MSKGKPQEERRPLTRRQRRIYDFLRRYLRQNGYPPCIREVCKHFEIVSPNGVMCHYQALEKKGWIRRTAGAARGIKILGE